MGQVKTTDGVTLYYEVAGRGEPIVFVHEFGGDHRSWEPQLRYFSRCYRCITFAARGYPPSDVPGDPTLYSQERAVDDVIAIMDANGIETAHVVGLSMGGFAALHLGLRFSERARSLVVASAGYGAEKKFEQYFRDVSSEVADQFETRGSEAYSHVYGMASSRIPFLNKDPRGWNEFRTMLGEHSATGVACTMRGVQARRPSLYDLENELKSMPLPTLVMVGDEDDHCLLPGIFLKRTIPAAGLIVMPKTGHTMNLEEPDAFNDAVSNFLWMVACGSWLPRDARSRPEEIMKTK